MALRRVSTLKRSCAKACCLWGTRQILSRSFSFCFLLRQSEAHTSVCGNTELGVLAQKNIVSYGNVNLHGTTSILLTTLKLYLRILQLHDRTVLYSVFFFFSISSHFCIHSIKFALAMNMLLLISHGIHCLANGHIKPKYISPAKCPNCLSYIQIIVVVSYDTQLQ